MYSLSTPEQPELEVSLDDVRSGARVVDRRSQRHSTRVFRCCPSFQNTLAVRRCHGKHNRRASLRTPSHGISLHLGRVMSEDQDDYSPHTHSYIIIADCHYTSLDRLHSKKKWRPAPIESDVRLILHTSFNTSSHACTHHSHRYTVFVLDCAHDVACFCSCRTHALRNPLARRHPGYLGLEISHHR